jgi:hypothetical protein
VPRTLRRFGSPIFILAISISVRMLVSWQVLHTTPLPRFWHGSEQGAIAKSILVGRGFASPYDERQPTAWVGPLYPCVVAVVFRVLGIYSSASTYFLVTLNALFSGLTSLLVYAMGKRVFGVEVGATAGWLWAFCLPDAVMPLLMWETCLSALLLTIGFLLSLALEDSSSYRLWGGTGLFWGGACLVNPSLISALFFFWVFFWFCQWKSGKNSWRQLTLSVVLFLAVLGPWLARNYRVFGKPVFVRSNLAAELYFGNLGFDSHPLGPTMEYQRLGEVAYIAEKKRLFLEYLRSNFGEFAGRSLHRAVSFWIVPEIAETYWLSISLLTFTGLGLALRKVRLKAAPFLIVLLTYPLVYYVSYVFPRYRHPIVPLMMVLSAYALVSTVHFSRQRIRALRGGPVADSSVRAEATLALFHQEVVAARKMLRRAADQPERTLGCESEAR